MSEGREELIEEVRARMVEELPEIGEVLLRRGERIAEIAVQAALATDADQCKAWRGELVSRIAGVYASQGDRGKSPGEVADEMLRDGWVKMGGPGGGS